MLSKINYLKKASTRPSTNRLRKKKDIERVFGGGKRFKEGLLILKINKNTLSQTRFGFIVSQKVSKKAVLRNKIKRRLREIVREKGKFFKKGLDILLIACPGLEKKDFWEIDETLDKLFKKAKCLIR
jgi:ribonuclease P protein component